jgi:hypothetical protein
VKRRAFGPAVCASAAVDDLRRLVVALTPMTQTDRHIPEKERCPVCEGVGWTWHAGEPQGTWIVCRECIGTGRGDHRGRKRQKPEEAPGG